MSLGHFVVRALMLEAAKQDNLDVDRLSFTGCLRVAGGLQKWGANEPWVGDAPIVTGFHAEEIVAL